MKEDLNPNGGDGKEEVMASLGDVTRRTKSKLLITSSVLFIAFWYGLEITEIPILGIKFPSGNSTAVQNILAWVVLYLSVMFFVF